MSISPNPIILLVDDEASIRRAISRALRRQGYEVRLAADGVEAMESLAQHGPPALLVLDLVMPNMDGRATLKAFRRQHPTLPVLVCTASDAQDLVGQPHLAVLEKPWSLDGFVHAVQSLLKRDAELRQEAKLAQESSMDKAPG